MNETEAIIHAFDEAHGQNCAMATVVSVEGSAYRRPGARMLVTESGASVGTISAGCLENDVVAHAQRAILSRAVKLVEYDTSSSNDEMAWGLGLGCNGVVRVLVEPLNPASSYVAALRASLTAQANSIIATVFHQALARATSAAIGSRLFIDPFGNIQCSIDDTALAAASIERDARAMRRNEASGVRVYETASGISHVFIETFAPPVPLVVFGAGADALPIIDLAHHLGWKTEIVDPQARDITRTRFAHAGKVTLARPESVAQQVAITSRTLTLLMTHNYAHDRALLDFLLASPARYVGVLGPRKRTERLLREFAGGRRAPDGDDRARLYAPAGLDIGADNAQEIALAIIGEMRAVMAAREGGQLRRRRAAIHDAQAIELRCGLTNRADAATPDGRVLPAPASSQTIDVLASAPIGVLLLAAGASRRLGVPKQLLPYRGQSLLRRAAQTALAARCGPVVVVLGAHRESVENEIADLPLDIVVNEQWGSGMAASIRAGIEHLIARAGCDTAAAVVMLCDQPRVDANLIEQLLSVYRSTNAPVVAAEYNGTFGVPALFDRRLYPDLLTLTGAQGAKNILHAYAAQLVAVLAPQAACDIDTMGDYERLHERKAWLDSLGT